MGGTFNNVAASVGNTIAVGTTAEAVAAVGMLQPAGGPLQAISVFQLQLPGA